MGGVPKPEGARLGPGDEEGRVPVAAGPAVEVVDQGVGRTQGEGDLVAGGPVEAGQTDQGRGQEEAACRHGLEEHRVEAGDPGRAGEDLGGQVDQEEGEGGPAFLLKKNYTRTTF